jgi:hypothetical protein
VQSDKRINVDFGQTRTVMKNYSMIALCILTISISVSGQKRDPASEWQIRFGRSWGRFHQHVEKQTVDSNGLVTYLNKRNGTPGTARISRRDVDEITELLKSLKLHTSKGIPSSEFNKCVGSPHMPNSYFSLPKASREYSLSHCREYGYTLILSGAQASVYKRLRVEARIFVR